MRLRCAILILVLAVTGCRGFPERTSRQDDRESRDEPLGPVERGGRGYTRSYDPTAGRVEVVPTRKTNRTNREQVVIATVYDRDGNSRRRQRVEWMIEGPGQLVEVDERGRLLGRGKRVDAKFGYSYTENFSRTVARTNDKRDDFEIQAGQTWCVVTSAVEGETRVIAYSPDIFDSSKNKVTSLLTWADSGKSTGTGRRERVEPREDDNFTRSPEPRLENIPPSDGLPPIPTRDTGTLTSRGEGLPQLTLDVKAPRMTGVGQELPITVALANTGDGTSQSLSIRATIPDEVEFVRSSPPVTNRTGNTLKWVLDPIRGNTNRDVVMTVRPTKVGTGNYVIRAESADGTSATKRIDISAEPTGLSVKLEGDTFASLGEAVPLQLTVTNTGNVAINNAIAWVELPDGFSIDKRQGSPIEIPVGRIPAQDSRTVPIAVVGTKPGKFPIKLNVTGDGGLAERTETNVNIGRAELEVAISGSESIPVGKSSIVEYRVTNRGDSTLRNVELIATLPRGVSVESATESGRATRDGASWNIGVLPAGETKAVRLNVRGDRVADRAPMTATADGLLANGSRIAAKKATADVSVTGLPILMLELADPSTPVPVGGRATYRITIRNRGNTVARDVEVSAEWSNEFRATRGSGPNRSIAQVGEKQLTFPKFDLAAGSTATFVVEGEGNTVGTAHVIAEVKCKEVTTAVREEQATRIVKNPR